MDSHKINFAHMFLVDVVSTVDNERKRAGK
jgi:hypothetical protein